jgi:hypothetical protein
MKRRLSPVALVAAVLLASIAPAAADDASDFFTLFDRTCAKSLTSQQAFIDAAKAAGATFKFALSGRPKRKWRRLGATRAIGSWTLARADSRCR